MRSKYFANISGDIIGGISAAMMALPGSIIFGILAFSPLGPEYVGQGILAGIYASVFAGIITSFLSSTEVLIAGPRAPAGLVFASVIAQLMATGYFSDSGVDTRVILTLGFAAVFLSGVFQLLFCLLRIGKLVKYISFPVVAGIMNGTFLIIVLKSVWNYFGVAKQSWGELFGNLGQIKPLAFLVALTTTLLWIGAKKYIPKIPGSIAALIGGSLLYYGLSLAGLSAHIGGTMQVTVETSLPNTEYFLGIFKVLTDRTWWRFLPIVLTGALTIAVLCSIESLLVMLAAQNLTRKRASGNRELMGQGTGNIVTALFGGIAAGGALGRITVNYKSGGRGRMSGLAFSLFTWGLILLFARYLQYIPKAVIAGMALRVSLLILDKWSLKLLKAVFRKKLANRRELLLNILIILLVMFSVIVFNMITAVGIGIGLSIIMFVETMSKSVVRGIHPGSRIRSKKQRYVKVMELLEKHGDCIATIELEGTFFFGVTDNLVSEIDRLAAEGVTNIILDMKRVTRIDVSGEKVLRQTFDQMKKKGVALVFGYLYPGGPLWRLLQDLGFIDAVGENNLFADTDLALEYCEDRVINAIAPEQLSGVHFNLQEFLGLEKDNQESLEQIKNYMHKKEFENGELVIKQGEAGDAAYVIVEGAVAVTIQLPGEERAKRLTTLAYGTIFGEMALLDQGARSADIQAIEHTVCYRITSEEFDRMKKEAPGCAMLLRDAISRILVARIRQANATVAELER